MLFCVSVVALCSFTACGGNEGKKIYRDILERYKVALDEDWDFESLQTAGMSYLYMYHDDREEEIGFAFYDIDGNGSPELLIGEVAPDDSYMGIIYDMYTVVDDEIISVLSSGERSRYYLCDDNRIAFEGSGGAGYYYHMYYDFDGQAGTLQPKEAVIYDGEYDQKEPWFYTFGSLDKKDYSPTTEREAQEIINSYVYSDYDVTPFSRY